MARACKSQYHLAFKKLPIGMRLIARLVKVLLSCCAKRNLLNASISAKTRALMILLRFIAPTVRRAAIVLAACFAWVAP
jgi:hypothetical protein